jgi:hypothetical protein
VVETLVHVARNVGAIREFFLCRTHREDQLAVPVQVEELKGTPAEYGAGLRLAIEGGWLWLHRERDIRAHN